MDKVRKPPNMHGKPKQHKITFHVTADDIKEAKCMDPIKRALRRHLLQQLNEKYREAIWIKLANHQICMGSQSSTKT